MVTRQPTVEEEALRYAAVLRRAIRAAGFSVSEVERRLGLGPKALRRVLGGQIDFKFRHMVAVLRLIGMTQEEFFTIALAERHKRRQRAKSRELLESFQRRETKRAAAAAATTAPDADPETDLSDDELDQKVEEVLLQLMRRQAARSGLPMPDFTDEPPPDDEDSPSGEPPPES